MWSKGAKRVLKRVKRMGKAVSRVHTVWVDGGYDGTPFLIWVMDVCRWIVQVVLRPSRPKALSCSKALGRRAHVRLADGVAPIG